MLLIILALKTSTNEIDEWKIFAGNRKDFERWRAISDWKRFRAERRQEVGRFFPARSSESEISAEQLQKRKWHDLILGSPRIGP